MIIATTRRSGRKARVIIETHRRSLFDQIDGAAARGRFSAIRARALYTLAITTGLRLTECLELDLGDVVDLVRTNGRRTAKIRSVLELEAHKAKLGQPDTITIGRGARAALARLVEAMRAGVFEPGWQQSPLFITGRGRGSESGGKRLPKRAAQADFTHWQRVASIAPRYRWHDLRHTAITRFAELAGGDAFKVAAFARHRDIRNSQRYVHTAGVAAIAEEL